MKAITQEFKENIKLFGRELDSIITYELNGDTVELGNTQLNSVSPHYEGGLLKSVMKSLDIDSNEDIPLETIINFQFGVKTRNDDVEDYRDNYDYIDFGNYVVYKSEKKEDTKSYKLTCYDKMLYSMKDYEDLEITYPITIRNYINAIATYMGVTFANVNDTFANYDKEIPNEMYLSYDNETETYSSLGYTFRDVLDELSQVTASTICINDDDELEVRYINTTNDTIDAEYLKNINVNFGESYGPINTIVLSRSAGTDNVYFPSPLPQNPNEYKISDNQIMNGNDRADYLPDIYNKLNGLSYYLNDYSSTGICYYDLCDRYTISIDGNSYSCIMLNDDIQITQGLTESIFTEMPEESVTDYTKADSTDRKINQTQLIVDKQQGIIESLVSNTTYISDTKTGTGTITLENAHEGQLYKLSIKGNISLLFPQSSVEYGHPVVPMDTLVPSNTLVPSSPVPYDNEIHYPSSNLYLKGTTLTIDETEYALDFDFLNYYSASIYDEFIYENGSCYIIRRVGVDSNGDMYGLTNEIIEPRKSVILNVKSNSTITLNSFPSAILTATYLLENEFTDNFATEAYVQSSIKQTADSITQEVNQKVGDDEIVAKLNLAVRDRQGIVELVGNQVIINSDHFQLDAEGNITATNGTFSGDISGSTITGGTITGTTVSGSTINGSTINMVSTGDNPKLTIDDSAVTNCKLEIGARKIMWVGTQGGTIVATSSMSSPIIKLTDIVENLSTNVNATYIETPEVRTTNLSVTGTKNRVVPIGDGKKVLLNSYETPTPYFGDIGSNITDLNGYCKIEIEEIFNQTIENDDYKVFIQECGHGNLYVEKHTGYFEVYGTPNLNFDWEIKAIQKGYKNTRLEEYKEKIELLEK